MGSPSVAGGGRDGSRGHSQGSGVGSKDRANRRAVVKMETVYSAFQDSTDSQMRRRWKRADSRSTRNAKMTKRGGIKRVHFFLFHTVKRQFFEELLFPDVFPSSHHLPSPTTSFSTTLSTSQPHPLIFFYSTYHFTLESLPLSSLSLSLSSLTNPHHPLLSLPAVHFPNPPTPFHSITPTTHRCTRLPSQHISSP
jgi:hypothetical protein